MHFLSIGVVPLITKQKGNGKAVEILLFKSIAEPAQGEHSKKQSTAPLGAVLCFYAWFLKVVLSKALSFAN
jgi:hypothetical protein